MRTVAEEYDRVVGVDTHAATHTMSLRLARLQTTRLDQLQFRVDSARKGANYAEADRVRVTANS